MEDSKPAKGTWLDLAKGKEAKSKRMNWATHFTWNATFVARKETHFARKVTHPQGLHLEGKRI